MIKLSQTVHNLIGSPEDIKALESKASARILVISDSHGKYNLLKEIVNQYGPGCDALVFCGDGSMDMVMLLDEASYSKELCKNIPPVVAMVQGNGDYTKYEVSFGNKVIAVPEKQVLCVNHTNFMIVHGHREGVNWGFEQCGFTAQMEGCKHVFYGHTHIAREERVGEYTFVNPGSCSLPRGGQSQGFAIATVEPRFVDIAFIKINRSGEGINKYSLYNPLY